jgi:fatty-acyl-CoA synthase
VAKESFLSNLRRVVRFGVKTGLVGNFDLLDAPKLAGVVLGAGLNIKTVHALHARTHPHRLAAVDRRRSVDYKSLDLLIRKATAALRAAGVARGTRVLLCMENRVEYLVTWFALFRIGAPAVHASYRATSSDLDYLLRHSGATVAVYSDTSRKALEGVTLPPSLSANVDSEFWDWLESAEGDESIDAGAEGGNVVYTSGTTGKPKGAVRDFASFGIVELSRIVERLPVREGDRHLIVCPLYHSGAQALALMQTSLGATLYLEPHFDAATTLQAMHDSRIHSMFAVPTMIRRLLDLPDESWRASPPADLRSLVSGAAAFPHALRSRAIRRFGASVVHDFYGATELGWITLIGGGEMMQSKGSVGRALPGQEIKIVAGDGRDQQLGQVGTIYVRNKQVMRGYLSDSNATDETLLPGGWMTVDDLGHLDEKGYLYLAGRDRDMVISGGVNIYPVEIEEALARYDGVREVAVIGVQDDDWGERLVACVVWETGGKRNELEAFARNELASFKVPRQWVSLERLPRNPTGKVLKRELREQLQ